MQPMTRGRSWPQFNVQENGSMNVIKNILQDKTNKNQL